MERRGFMEWRKIRTGSESAHIGRNHSPHGRCPEDTGQTWQRLYGYGIRAATAVLLISFAAHAGVLGTSDKLTDDEKIELIRGLTAEYAKAKVPLAKSKKGLEFNSDGTWDRKKWNDMFQ